MTSDRRSAVWTAAPTGQAFRQTVSNWWGEGKSLAIHPSALRSEAQMQTNLAAFARPIAHRGLHSETVGIIENTDPAFDAAVRAQVAIECDVQRTRDNGAAVFHDPTLDRLCGRQAAVSKLDLEELCGIPLINGKATIQSLVTVLDNINGAVPIVVEVKVLPTEDPVAWLDTVASMARSYLGPIALKSFDAIAVKRLRGQEPRCPVGWVCEQTPNASQCADVKPDFLSVRISNLTPELVAGSPIPVVMGWTVATARDLETSVDVGVAPVFEALAPATVSAVWKAGRTRHDRTSQ